jgi:2-amino-4-hydroxy-6-hydroxymethyldihydropteridine diphosphokinase
VPEVLLALGSNVGDRLANLCAAVEALSQRIDLLAVSSIYETAPMYLTDQQPFLNAALRAKTLCYPLQLLRLLKDTEVEVGRRAGKRFGPREIDIDLIAYGCLRYHFKGGERPLEVPHPRVAERRFVLQPLSDVSPDASLPGMGSIRELLDRTSEQARDVQRIEHALLPIHGDR